MGVDIIALVIVIFNSRERKEKKKIKMSPTQHLLKMKHNGLFQKLQRRYQTPTIENITKNEKEKSFKFQETNKMSITRTQ
jgi:hypothetical protein